MRDTQYFERLLETAGLIARHADFPGKRQVVERCREEVEQLTCSGAISNPRPPSDQRRSHGGVEARMIHPELPEWMIDSQPRFACSPSLGLCAG